MYLTWTGGGGALRFFRPDLLIVPISTLSALLILSSFSSNGFVLLRLLCEEPCAIIDGIKYLDCNAGCIDSLYIFSFA